MLLAIQIIPILTSALLMVVLAALLGALIVYMSKKFYVEPDVRVERIRDILSGSNCGACGYPGCDAFAKAVLNGKTTAARCPQLKIAAVTQINEIAGNKNANNTQMGESSAKVVSAKVK